jgi:putative transposase
VSQTISPSTSRPYGLALSCRALEIARSTVYAIKAREATSPRPPEKRGPKTEWSDAELTERIREAIASSPWLGEGYRQVWARLRPAGIRTRKRRVLRLMREAGLLAPTRVGRAHGPKAHDGTITTERPDEMWGSDATGCLTDEGHATIFVAVDHCTQECTGIHAARRGTRFEALEPIRQGVRERFGGYAEEVAAGLALRHDHGSQFTSDDYQNELTFLGITSSPAYVREPEGNGVSERFIRTLKEQLLWIRRFASVDELGAALQAFKDSDNREWLAEKHGHLTPAAARASLTMEAAA